MTDQRLAVGAVMYPGFEMLDMFGPLEMLSILGEERVEIRMLAETDEPVPTAMGAALTSGPRVNVDATFANAGPIDILLVPGGFGTMPQLGNPAMIEFIQASAENARYVASVCTGSLLLARAGLLDGRRATTNKQFFALSAQESTAIEWVERARWVEDGKFFTSSGVSAGMDMTLALIRELFGVETSEMVAIGTEYTWHRDRDEDPFAAHLNGGMGMLGSVD